MGIPSQKHQCHRTPIKRGGSSSPSSYDSASQGGEEEEEEEVQDDSVIYSAIPAKKPETKVS